MFCSKCGFQVDDDDIFCRRCGAALKASPATETEEQRQQREWQIAAGIHGKGSSDGMPVAGAIIFFIGFLVAFFYQGPVGILIICGGLALWIIGASRRGGDPESEDNNDAQRPAPGPDPAKPPVQHTSNFITRFWDGE